MPAADVATDHVWVVCFGWDVGGWMGRKHGAAAVAWHPGSQAIEWLGPPRQFRLPGPRLGFLEFVALAASEADLTVLDGARIVVGIDAPLGYPSAYRRLVSGDAVYLEGFSRELDNGFAYRETERHVHGALGKKPLSAPFDKLGNNATVAISHARWWSAEHELKVVPFATAERDENVILEVYPALAKTKDGEPIPSLAPHMPPDVERGTDAYDAALCALVALAYAADGRIEGLPVTCGPQGDPSRIREEGWIFYPEDRAGSSSSG